MGSITAHCHRRRRKRGALLSNKSTAFSYDDEQRYTSRTPSNNIDSLRVLLESGKVCNLAFFAVCFDLPYLKPSQHETRQPVENERIPERACHRQRWPACPCRGVRNEPSKWGCFLRARRPAAEQPSWCLVPLARGQEWMSVDKMERRRSAGRQCTS